MHRYWIHVFPEDFHESSVRNSFYHDLVIEALDIADKHLLDLKKFCDRTNTDLLVASSMGQAAIDRGRYYPEYIINDPNILISFLGLSSANYTFLLSMQPDIIVECNSLEARDLLLQQILLFTDSSKLQLLKHRYSSDSLRVNLSLATSKADDAEKNVFFNRTCYPLAQSGLKVIHRHQGTAYHIPEGIVIGYGTTIQRYLSAYDSTPIDTTHFKQIILDFMNPKAYNVLILGSNGVIGSALAEYLSCYYTVFTDKKTNLSCILNKSFIVDSNINIIVNCIGSYTNDEDLFHSNFYLPLYIAQFASELANIYQLNIVFINISSLGITAPYSTLS